MADNWVGKKNGWMGDRKKRKRKPKPDSEEKATLESIPPVEYIPIKCPICGTKSPVYKTIRPKKEGDPIYRYHKCPECGRSFPSREDTV